jgi:hypothetical protein
MGYALTSTTRLPGLGQVTLQQNWLRKQPRKKPEVSNMDDPRVAVEELYDELRRIVTQAAAPKRKHTRRLLGWVLAGAGAVATVAMVLEFKRVPTFEDCERGAGRKPAGGKRGQHSE